MSEDYIKTLELGKHTIKFILDDGREGETIFTVLEKEIEDSSEDKIEDKVENKIEDSIKDTNLNNPQTGDNIGIYVAIFIVSVLGISAIILIKNKRQK